MGALWRKVKLIMEGRDDAAVKCSFLSQVEIAAKRRCKMMLKCYGQLEKEEEQGARGKVKAE